MDGRTGPGDTSAHGLCQSALLRPAGVLRAAGHGCTVQFLPESWRSATSRGRRVSSPARREQLAPFPLKRRYSSRREGCCTCFPVLAVPYFPSPLPGTFGYSDSGSAFTRSMKNGIRLSLQQFAGKESYVPADTPRSFGELLGHFLRVVPATFLPAGSYLPQSRTAVGYPGLAEAVPDPSSTLAKSFTFSSAELPRR